MGVFRKRSGSALCYSCGKLNRVDAAVCFYCGRRQPGLWGFAPSLGRLFGRLSVAKAITLVCGVTYLLALALDPGAAMRPRGVFNILSPSSAALDALGMTGSYALARGRWWTLLTAIYLHGSLLHVAFNMLWVNQLAPAVEEVYGRARLIVIFTAAGVLGFALSGTLLGSGPFARPSSTLSLVLLQLYTSVLALTGLVLGALTGERRRADRQRAAVHATTTVLAEAIPPAQVSTEVLRAICGNLEWDVGSLWGVDRTGGVLRCLGVWSRPGVDATEFTAATRALTFAPGVGLPGRVWAAGEPAWIPDVVRDANFPRATVARRVGLHAGFGFPIRIRDQVEGVIEFFSWEVEEPDEALLQVVGTMGVQLGQFLERRRAEEALQRSQRELAERVEELAESDRRKDEFLAMLAHELRNPLAPIAAAAEILRDAASADTSVTRATEILDRQVQHMVKLIDDLLDVSRISRRKIRLDRSNVQLATVVEHALEVSRGLIEARNHRLVVALPPEDIVLNADLTRLAQALANLLNNAAKFTEPGGHIRLEAELEDGELAIRVRDSGIGIEPKLLPRVFDLFFQSATASDRAYGGLGIGLTLVRTLIEMHGGRVSAKSDGVGSGSEFSVHLPARRRFQELRSDPAHRTRTAPPRALRILLVEDHEDSAEALAHLLRRRGHETHIASDGNRGLEDARALRPDVVLLDLGLPGLDGYEVARRLREHGGAAFVLLVAVSGYGQDADRRRSSEAGFDHHLVKPVKLEELERILALAPRQPNPA
jgi:signal transduction histidine kinase/membrane associated rhomboid family serine protease/ActR/RegA family two-component response regulator